MIFVMFVRMSKRVIVDSKVFVVRIMVLRFTDEYGLLVNFEEAMRIVLFGR